MGIFANISMKHWHIDVFILNQASNLFIYFLHLSDSKRPSKNAGTPHCIAVKVQPYRQSSAIDETKRVIMF